MITYLRESTREFSKRVRGNWLRLTTQKNGGMCSKGRWLPCIHLYSPSLTIHHSNSLILIVRLPILLIYLLPIYLLIFYLSPPPFFPFLFLLLSLALDTIIIQKSLSSSSHQQQTLHTISTFLLLMTYQHHRRHRQNGTFSHSLFLPIVLLL